MCVRVRVRVWAEQSPAECTKISCWLPQKKARDLK